MTAREELDIAKDLVADCEADNYAPQEAQARALIAIGELLGELVDHVVHPPVGTTPITLNGQSEEELVRQLSGMERARGADEKYRVRAWIEACLGAYGDRLPDGIKASGYELIKELKA